MALNKTSCFALKVDMAPLKISCYPTESHLDKPLLHIRDLKMKSIVFSAGDILSKYFRLEIEGLEHLPKSGKALITPNHSGFSGLDALLLGYGIYKNSKRIPRILTHKLWFISKFTTQTANRFGFIEASIKNGVQLLSKNNLVVIFPEGESGNFKPSSQKYRLQEFHRGFIRMALTTQSPIVPCLILGAEEANINLKQSYFVRKLFGLKFPMPLNLLPFPSKWKIKFLPPIHLPFLEEATQDPDLIQELAQEIQENMQESISRELAKRKYVYVSRLF